MISNSLVTKIIESKKECVFISPHFDDVILSCGELLRQLSGKVTITVVNVFTKAHSGPYTISAKKFLKDSGHTMDAVKLYKKRLLEDTDAFAEFDVKVVNLGLTDALFRKKKNPSIFGKVLAEFDHVYPTYRWHMTALSSKDEALTTLESKLHAYTGEDTLVFSPIGIGSHVDHLVVKKVCEKLFPHIVFYEDFPYNVRIGQTKQQTSLKERFEVVPTMEQKTKDIQKYASQYVGLFEGKSVPLHTEVYFSKAL